MTATWDIFAAEVGLLDVPVEIIAHEHPEAGRIDVVPVLMWVLCSAQQVVVVDTGVHAEGSAEARAHPRGLRQEPGHTPLEALARLGIDPAEVGYVINTHLHWDHSSNNDLFENATVIVQSREVLASINPPPGQDLSFESGDSGLEPPWLKARRQTQMVDGDYDVTAGVSVVLLPGHTPGSQGVIVNTADGPVLLAGDAVPVEENVLFAPARLPGILWSAQHARDSLDRIESWDLPLIAAHQVPKSSVPRGDGLWQLDPSQLIRSAS